jgi:hypothetical protein
MTAQTRRAALGAVLAAGAVGAIPAVAAIASPTLSPVDKRVQDLWLRRRRLKAIARHWSQQSDAADAALPAWARSGPVYVRLDGTAAGREISGWPQVADLSRRPAFPSGAVYSRPDVNNVISEWREKKGAGTDLARALIEWGSRVLEQTAEKERAGVAKCDERCERTFEAIRDVENMLRDHIGESIFALAAVIVAEIGVEDEDVPGLLRASLAALRPQLVGPIAEDADRMLASGAQVDAAGQEART